MTNQYPLDSGFLGVRREDRKQNEVGKDMYDSLIFLGGSHMRITSQLCVLALYF